MEGSLISLSCLKNSLQYVQRMNKGGYIMTFIPNNACEIKELKSYEGPLTAKIALIGEAWGDREEKDGRPFVGPAGQALDRLLSSADINRFDCFVTNVVKARPRPEYKN